MRGDSRATIRRRCRACDATARRQGKDSDATVSRGRRQWRRERARRSIDACGTERTRVGKRWGCYRPNAAVKSSPARGGGPRSGGGVPPYREGDTPPSGLRPATSPCRGGWSGSDQRRKLTGYGLSPTSGPHGDQSTRDVARCFSYDVCRVLFCDASIRSFHECAHIGVSIHGRLGRECAHLAHISYALDT